MFFSNLKQHQVTCLCNDSCDHEVLYNKEAIVYATKLNRMSTVVQSLYVAPPSQISLHNRFKF